MKPGRPQTVKTSCPYCGVGCGLLVHRDAQGGLRVEGDPEHPSSQGRLCSKGLNLHRTAMDTTDRLLQPMMRTSRAAELKPVSWDEALDRAAAVFSSLIKRFGPDSVAFYGSGQFLTEEYYILNKLVKGFLGTNNLDTNSRLCMSTAVAAYKQALGEDLVPVCYEDLDLADCFLIAGANPAWCHPVIFRRIEANKAARPATKLIVVDPRKTQTAMVADLHLALLPGSDIHLFHALARLLIENGHTDADFIAASTTGFAELKELVFQTTLEDSAQLTGLTPKDIRTAAEWIGQAKGFLTLWTMGLNQSAIGVNKNLALINLNLLTGKIGKPGSGPFSLTGQPNAMGGREVGGLANLASAHRDLANPAHRQEIADYWGVPSIPAQPGLTAVDLFKALEDGRVKAVWILATNPVVSLPDSAQVERALKNAKFVVVQDMSAKAQHLAFADLILPAATWLEKSGTMTNSERRIAYLPQLLTPPGQARPDAIILRDFARKLGFGAAFDYPDTAAIYDEHVGLTKGTNLDISGLSHARLQENRSFQWPVPTPDSAGTPRLFTDGRFATPDGRARLKAVPPENTSEPLSTDFPLILTTGRIRDQWHTMTRTGKVAKLGQHLPDPFLEIHPQDAAARDIADGAPVVVSGLRGQVRVNARVTTDIRPGVVFLPMHWGRNADGDASRANNLTNPLYDPVSREPDLKFAAVQVAPWVKPAETILIVGAGAAAAKFVTAYRSRNQTDRLVVFSAEAEPFYNRVLLPEYITGTAWEALLKLKPADWANLNLEVRAGCKIVGLDRQAKTLTDEQGQTYSYDRLVLATGSRSFFPPQYPRLPGVFTLRTRADADRIRGGLTPGDQAIIVGGGLLGLELAAALLHLGIRVTLIQRSGRLMDKQLDETAAGLLAEWLAESGLTILFYNEIKKLEGEDRLTGVKLADGKTLPCQALVFAAGTTPNIELAQAAGLSVGRGITVDHFLRTSDPAIQALGEAAEFRGQIFGITASAEEQAEIAVRHLLGDNFGGYNGSTMMNLLKIEGLTLCSIGLVHPPKGDPAYEEITLFDRSRRYYKKCLIHQDRLVGALLMGDKTEFLEFRDLIVNGTELGDRREKILRTGTSSAKPVRGRLVCSCAQVGQDNLLDEIKAGCRTVAALGEKTGAGTVCGSCRPDLAHLLAQTAEAP